MGGNEANFFFYGGMGLSWFILKLVNSIYGGGGNSKINYEEWKE